MGVLSLLGASSSKTYSTSDLSRRNYAFVHVLNRIDELLYCYRWYCTAREFFVLCDAAHLLFCVNLRQAVLIASDAMPPAEDGMEHATTVQ